MIGHSGKSHTVHTASLFPEGMSGWDPLHVDIKAPSADRASCLLFNELVFFLKADMRIDC